MKTSIITFMYFYSTVCYESCEKQEADNISVQEGGYAILHCEPGVKHSAKMNFDWTTCLPEKKEVFRCQDGKPMSSYQDDAYKGRVFSMNNASVRLGPVKKSDSGRYKCAIVTVKKTPTFRYIDLLVLDTPQRPTDRPMSDRPMSDRPMSDRPTLVDPGDDAEKGSIALALKVLVGVAVVVLVGVAVVLGVALYRWKKGYSLPTAVSFILGGCPSQHQGAQFSPVRTDQTDGVAAEHSPQRTAIHIAGAAEESQSGPPPHAQLLHHPHGYQNGGMMPMEAGFRQGSPAPSFQPQLPEKRRMLSGERPVTCVSSV